MQREWREGDIVSWWYNEEGMKKCSSIYWCNSQIAIFNENGVFCDTYWAFDNKTFKISDIGKTIEVDFVANLDELDHITPDNGYVVEDLRKHYSSKDIINLNHSNKPWGNLYLRKDAKKKIDIMRESYKSSIRAMEEKIEHLQWKLKQTKEEFENLSEENFEEHKIWL